MNGLGMNRLGHKARVPSNTLSNNIKSLNISPKDINHRVGLLRNAQNDIESLSDYKEQELPYIDGYKKYGSVPILRSKMNNDIKFEGEAYHQKKLFIKHDRLSNASSDDKKVYNMFNFYNPSWNGNVD